VKHTWPTTIERHGREVEVKVGFDFTPGCAATWEHPGDPDEIEVHYQAFAGAQGYLLNSEEQHRIETEIAEGWSPDDGPDPDDARDRMIDDRLCVREASNAE